MEHLLQIRKSTNYRRGKWNEHFVALNETAHVHFHVQSRVRFLKFPPAGSLHRARNFDQRDSKYRPGSVQHYEGKLSVLISNPFIRSVSVWLCVKNTWYRSFYIANFQHALVIEINSILEMPCSISTFRWKILQILYFYLQVHFLYYSGNFIKINR